MLTMFNVDEIIVFDDGFKFDNSKINKEEAFDPACLFISILKYLETPQ